MYIIVTGMYLYIEAFYEGHIIILSNRGDHIIITYNNIQSYQNMQ